MDHKEIYSKDVTEFTWSVTTIFLISRITANCYRKRLLCWS